MSTFRQVFSTTGKVVLSLFLIFLVLGIGWAVFSAASRNHVSSSGSDPTSSSTDSTERFADTQADEASSTMPKSQWDAEVKAAIATHCIFAGMSKAQVEQSLGKIGHNGAFSEYKQPNQKCVKYSGDACVEYDSESMYLDFSKHGNFKETFMSTYRFASASVNGVPIVCWAPSWTTDSPKRKIRIKTEGLPR